MSEHEGDVWVSTDPVAANEAYAELAGKTVFTAQKNIVEMLAAAGAMDGDPRPITHPVKFWENGKRSEEHTSELQSLMRTSYAVFCLKKKNQHYTPNRHSEI